MGHVLLSNDVRREGPAQRVPQRDRGGRDGNGAVERELPGLLPRVGQVSVRLRRGVLVRRILARCILVRGVLVRYILVSGVPAPCILARSDAGIAEVISDSASTAISDPISTAVSDSVSTAISARGSGSAAVRGRSRHAPEVSAAA
ncbi:hypothetical protein ABH915_000968 [Arthrobacter sp. MW3 TE3886]